MVKKVLIIAGEASGDNIGAMLVRETLLLKNDILFFGLGGTGMKAAGVNLIHNISEMGVIGFSDVIKKYPILKNIYNDTCDWAKTNMPDCAVLIDYPGFNLKLAGYLKSLGIPVVYYVSPQIWAWGKGRIKKIKALVDKMFVVFAFEEPLYRNEGVPVCFVGNPLLDTVMATKPKEQIISELGLFPEKITIGILPGSRQAEITRILPSMIATAKIIQDTVGKDNVQFVLPVAKTLSADFVKSFFQKSEFEAVVVENNTYNAVSVCKAAMVTSGTATLETALLNIPMAIFYKTGFLTYLIALPLIKVPYIGIVNIIAGEKIVPEFIQFDINPKKIAQYFMRLLSDRPYYENAKKSLIEIRHRLGEKGASKRAAMELLDVLC